MERFAQRTADLRLHKEVPMFVLLRHEDSALLIRTLAMP
jgi:hypothetical protein